jgi:hypothetical protein
MINGQPFKNLGFADLGVALACEDDLDAVGAALAREVAIRQVMAETGESREVVEEAVGAIDAMADEAVLDLCEGQPTTLGDALSRYVDGLPARWPDGADLDQETVTGDLVALLSYPWPKP